MLPNISHAKGETNGMVVIPVPVLDLIVTLTMCYSVSVEVNSSINIILVVIDIRNRLINDKVISDFIVIKDTLNSIG